MGTITIRVDDNLKDQAYKALKDMDITPSELLRQTLKYVAENNKLPFKPVLLNDDDLDILTTARERLNDPKPVAVSLNDL